MSTESQKINNNLSPTKSSIDFEQALLEIDESFNATMNELERLHQKKIDLILLYKKAQEQQDLLKIRSELK